MNGNRTNTKLNQRFATHVKSIVEHTFDKAKIGAQTDFFEGLLVTVLVGITRAIWRQIANKKLGGCNRSPLENIITV